MRALITVLIGFSTLGSSIASAKDVNVCAILANALAQFQDSYVQAKFASDNAATVCADDKNVQECSNQLMVSLQNASARVADEQSNYKRAGCLDGE